jgi:hypothetical protein
MYVVIAVAFIPNIAHGRASVMKFVSMETALTISVARSSVILFSG